MNFRITALLVALPAVIAGLLVATPAEASSYDATVSTNYVAIAPDGTGKVYMTCHSSHTCKGKISFTNDTGTPRTRDYSVGGNRSAYVSVAVHADALVNPQNPLSPRVNKGDYYAISNVSLKVNEDSPQNVTHYYTVTTETLLKTQQITGSVNGPLGGVASDVRVELLSVLRGGNTELVRSASVANGGSYSFTVNLHTNNSPSSEFKLRISATDQNGGFRSWFWRGSDNSPRGGGRYLREASTVQATKYGDYDADFRYSSITGTITNNVSPGSTSRITVAAPPVAYSSSVSTRREYDLPHCANIYGQTRTNTSGAYRVDFLPFDQAVSDKRYMVGARYGSTELWNGSFGSCLDTMNYSTSQFNLIALGAGAATKSFTLRRSGNRLTVSAPYSGFSPTAKGDRWIRLREKVPGLRVLEAPVVAQASASQGGGKVYRTFDDVPPGDYWVEVGRRTGCTGWYPSVFSNNDAYFSGLDRGSEAWKTVAGKYAEYQKSYDMGYVATTPPSGYRGWMYRDYCKAYGAGTINTTSISGFDNTLTKITSTNHKGAIVHGHVSRSGGRTNKEMLVRLSSSGQVLVLRTDVTDSSGNFYIAGLASGTYTISVNSDSWRGIGRSFSGQHTITVSRGNTYGVGTLSFSG